MHFEVKLVQASPSAFTEENCTRVGDYLFIYEGDLDAWPPADESDVVDTKHLATGVTEGGYGDMGHVDIMTDVVRTFGLTFISIQKSMDIDDRVVSFMATLEDSLSRIGWLVK